MVSSRINSNIINRESTKIVDLSCQEQKPQGNTTENPQHRHLAWGDKESNFGHNMHRQGVKLWSLVTNLKSHISWIIQ